MEAPAPGMAKHGNASPTRKSPRVAVRRTQNRTATPKISRDGPVNVPRAHTHPAPVTPHGAHCYPNPPAPSVPTPSIQPNAAPGDFDAITTAPPALRRSLRRPSDGNTTPAVARFFPGLFPSTASATHQMEHSRATTFGAETSLRATRAHRPLPLHPSTSWTAPKP